MQLPCPDEQPNQNAKKTLGRKKRGVTGSPTGKSYPRKKNVKKSNRRSAKQRKTRIERNLSRSRVICGPKGNGIQQKIGERGADFKTKTPGQTGRERGNRRWGVRKKIPQEERSGV